MSICMISYIINNKFNYLCTSSGVSLLIWFANYVACKMFFSYCDTQCEDFRPNMLETEEQTSCYSVRRQQRVVEEKVIEEYKEEGERAQLVEQGLPLFL